VPGVKAAIRRHLFHHQIAAGQVHEHQHHPLQKGFIHRPDDRAYLTMGNALLFPRCGRLEDDAFQRVHDAAQGTWRAPHMPLQVKTAKKLADGFGSHTSFEAEHKQGRHNQADQPGAAGWRFPQRRLRVAVPAIHGLEVSMYAAFGQPGAIRQAPDALLAVCTNRVENDNTLGPQSHGAGPCSGGWRTSRTSALQSTGSPATCPALRGWSRRMNTMRELGLDKGPRI